MGPTINSASINGGTINPGGSQLIPGENTVNIGGDFSDRPNPWDYQISFHGPPNGTIAPASISIDHNMSNASWLVATFNYESAHPPEPEAAPGQPKGKDDGRPRFRLFFGLFANGDFTVTVKDPVLMLSATFDFQDVGGTIGFMKAGDPDR